mmetsp:Transcript_6764/g.9671  ORF Transcript_6764/g.9671 Transcript_6764/m.9671 type:complete len:168 (-) Transcript_6764:307-810(-)
MATTKMTMLQVWVHQKMNSMRTNKHKLFNADKKKPPSFVQRPASMNGKDSLDASMDFNMDDDDSDEESDNVIISQLKNRRTPMIRRGSLSNHQGYSFQRMISGSLRKGVKTILGRDADDFKNAEEMENNFRWQRVAGNIDSAARLIFPATYILFLAIAFGRSNTGLL